jgi:hypothetical protein
MVKQKGGHYKITEQQAANFWRLHCSGLTTRQAAAEAGITYSQGFNIRAGKAWNKITGKPKVVYDDY